MKLGTFILASKLLILGLFYPKGAFSRFHEPKITSLLAVASLIEVVILQILVSAITATFSQFSTAATIGMFLLGSALGIIIRLLLGTYVLKLFGERLKIYQISWYTLLCILAISCTPTLFIGWAASVWPGWYNYISLGLGAWSFMLTYFGVRILTQGNGYKIALSLVAYQLFLLFVKWTVFGMRL